MKPKRKPSERKRARPALRKRGRRPRAAEQRPASLDNFPEAFIGFDTELNIRYANRRAGEMLGYEPKDLPGRDYRAEVATPDDAPFVAACLRALETGTPQRLETFGAQAGRWIESRIHPSEQGLSVVMVDITERKQPEETLQAREQRFEALFENFPIAVWEEDFSEVANERRFRALIEKSKDASVLLNAAGEIIYESPMGLQIIGYSAEERIGRSGLELVHPDDLDRVRRALGGLIQQPGTEVNLELRSLRKDGSWRWLEATGTNLLADPSVQAIVVNYRDVTERRLMEEALRASEDKFRRIVESSPTAMYFYRLETDNRLVLTGANPAAERIIGIPHQPLIGKTIEAAFPNLARTDVPEMYRKIARGELGPQSFEIEYGDERFSGVYDVQVFPTGPATMAVAFIDITERKRAQKLLRDLSLAVNDSGDIVFMTDKDGLITSVNSQFTDLYGYRPDELIGKATPRILKSGVQSDEVYAQFWQTILRGELFRGEVVNRAKDGRLIFIEETVSPFWDDRGDVAGFLAIQRDITQRKQAEAALQYSQARLTEAQRIARLGNWEWNVATNTVWWSDEIYHIFGRRPGEFDGTVEGFLDCVHPRDRDVVRETIDRSLNARMPYDLDHGILLPDGTEKVVHEQAVVERDETGRPVRMAGVTLDITERKQAEEALRRRLAELEAISRISAALRTAPTRVEMLPVLMDETLLTLGTDSGVIWLHEPATGDLRVAVARGWFERLRESPIKVGEGIAGTTFSRGQAHLSREFASDPLTRPSMVERVPRGWGGICVPLRAAQDVAGVLFVAVQLPREITPEETKLLTSLAEMAGIALHRLRLHEETVRHLERLEALQTIDRAITASLDLRTILDVLLEQARARLGVDAASVLLLSPPTQMLEFKAARGFRTRAIERSVLRLGQGLAGRVALERRIMFVADLPAAGPEFPRAELLADETLQSYCAAPLIAKGQIKGVLEVFHRDRLNPDQEWLDFLETLAGQAAIAIDNAELFEGLRRTNTELIYAYETTIEGWSHALDLRDRETEGHTRRVAEMTLRLARAAGFGDEQLMQVRRGALLHDIGKMGVPDGVLLKPGPLTTEEWAIMQKHPQYAYEMLSSIAHLQPALHIPYCHHEKWDGTGYPRGLKGEAIPLEARLFAVVDVWDALRSDRPYRESWSEDRARDYIRAQAGKHFDPQVVNLFFNMLGEGNE